MSKPRFGQCGLGPDHGGPVHAVPIAEGYWFAYRVGSRRPIGYVNTERLDQLREEGNR
jgi:hypothetical protein